MFPIDEATATLRKVRVFLLVLGLALVVLGAQIAAGRRRGRR